MGLFGERVITCQNSDGDRLVIDEKGFKPFLLAVASGIYDTKNNISRSKNTLMDGAEYQGTVMEERNIVLTLKDKGDFDKNRDLIDNVFSKGSLGVMTVEDDSHKRQIEYYVESVTSTATPKVRLTTISLICPNPYFTDTYDTNIYLANIMPGFIFAHAFQRNGEPFSSINTSKIVTVLNGTSEKDIGLTISISARGDVLNPKINKIQTNEYIELGSEQMPFLLNSGDKVIITTHKGNKNITGIIDGVQNDINQYMTENSVYFQLDRGENSFGYSAESGEDYMTIEIAYRFSYKRA